MYTVNVSGRATVSEIKGFFNKIKAYFTGYIDNSVSIMAKEVFSELVDKTPVETGFARANWTFGGPKDLQYSKDIHHPPPEYDGPEFDGREYIRTTRGFTIYNHTRYIQFLNMGHSSQAPKNFIEIATDAGIRRATQIMRGR